MALKPQLSGALLAREPTAGSGEAATARYADIAGSAVRQNLSGNPNGAVSNAGYAAKTDSVTAITAAPARQTDNAGYQGRQTSLLATAAAAGSGEITLPPAVGLVAGQPFTASAYVAEPTSTTGGIGINWHAADGAYVSTTAAPNQGTPPSADYRRLSTTATVPAGATQARPYASIGGLAQGQTVRLSCQLNEPNAAAAGPYIDGDASGGTWSSTPGASTSTVIYATGVTGQKGDTGAAGATGPAGTTTLRGASDYDNSVAPTGNQGVLWVPDGSGSGRFAPRTITPGLIGAEASANRSITGAFVPNGYAGVDANGRVPGAMLYPGNDTQPGILSASRAAYFASPVGARSDRYVHGDEMSPFPRWAAAGTAGGALNTLYYFAVQSAYDDVATRVRLGARVASAGTGALNVAVFIGADPANLARVATASATAVAAGLVDLALSAQVSWTTGQWVVVAVQMTGFTTIPTFTASNTIAAMLNAGNVLLAVARGSVTTMPTALNLTTGGSSTGLGVWWSLT